MKASSRVARLASYALDLLIVAILQGIVNAMFPSVKILGAITGLFYFSLLTFYQGASLGKKVFGLKVVPEAGNTLTWRHVLMREVLGKIVSGLILGLGYIWIFFDKKRQGWHDKIGQTLVVEVTPLAGWRKILAYFFAVCMFILPVVAIVGILAAVVLTRINPIGQLQTANDVKVKSDVTMIGAAMEAYNTRNGYYPSTLQDLVVDGDLNTVPQAPDGYVSYFMDINPAGCSTTTKDCVSVSIRGNLQSVTDKYVYWCYWSGSKISSQTDVCDAGGPILN